MFAYKNICLQNQSAATVSHDIYKKHILKLHKDTIMAMGSAA